MAKLYVFGIGGTGARTIKSLTMLLAAGVESNYEIIPILIDPDKSAADVNRTKKILNDYKIIQEKSNQSKKSLFFKNKIGTLGNVVNTKHGNTMDNDNFVMNIPGIEGGRFKDFIDYSNFQSPIELFNFIEELPETEYIIRLNKCIKTYNSISSNHAEIARDERIKMLTKTVEKIRQI